MLFLLGSVLKAGGFRRGGTKRKSSRSKRWSRSAQTLFASWAVIGQLGAIGVLVGEALEPQLAKAQITAIPGDYGVGAGTANATGNGAFAIGRGALAENKNAVALGDSASASGTNSTAVGANSKALANRTTVMGGGGNCLNQYGYSNWFSCNFLWLPKPGIRGLCKCNSKCIFRIWIRSAGSRKPISSTR